MRLIGLIKAFHNDLRASLAKKLRAKEVVRVLSIAHAQELKETPIDSWQTTIQRQKQQIDAVMAGKLDIVDRRSWCFSDDTEVLTHRGWVQWPKVKESDKLASRNKRGKMTFEHSDELVKFKYKGKLLHFKTLGADLLVTPNHRMLGRKALTFGMVPKFANNEAFYKAKDIAKLKRLSTDYQCLFKVPVTAIWEEGDCLPKNYKIEIKGSSKKYKFKGEDWIAFLGAFIGCGALAGWGEGVSQSLKIKTPLYIQSLEAQKHKEKFSIKNVSHAAIKFCETTSYGKKKLKKLFKRMGIEYSNKSDGLSITSKAIKATLTKMDIGNSYTKKIPQFIKDLEPQYLQLFLKWMFRVSGWVIYTKKQGIAFKTTSKDLADDLQEIFQKIGSSAIILVDKIPNPGFKRRTAPIYIVRETARTEIGIELYEKVKYKGYVYCAKTKHGTLLVRRNGKPAWSGNSFPYLPESLHRLNVPVLKNTPYNLRRFAETPIPRRAINLIKNPIIMSLRWEVRPVAEADDLDPEREKRIRIATEVLKHPNRQDSFRSFWEQVVEDIIMGGYGAIEPRITPDYKRPLLMWPIDGSTIRIYADWTEATTDIKPHYAQMTGLKGERGIIAFYDKEIIYIRDNKRSSTPFGLGKMEVAFSAINYFLGSYDAAGKAGSDQIHKTMLWWNSAQQSANMQTVRRYITNELEGQSKISIIAGMAKPEVVDINAVTPEDLLLEWQQFQIKVIGQAFDISPISLGIDQHTNRATGQVMSDADFKSAVVPMAVRVQEAITYEVLHKRLGWKDLEFIFVGLEDPDPLTKVNIQQKKYIMNCLTPDEMREDEGRAPLPGGWGRLTAGQMQIIVAEAMAQSRAAGMGGGGGAGGGTGMPGGGGGMGSGMRMPSGGGGQGGMLGAGFSLDDITNMSPEDIQWLQDQGYLPPTDDLSNQMEQEQPGILKTLTQELQEFFDAAEQLEEEGEAQTEPEDISNKDKKDQMVKYKKSIHKPTVQETAMNRRYSDTANKDRQFAKVTSRYPRELTPEDRKALRK